MKREITPPSRAWVFGYRIILGLLIALIILLAAGSLAALLLPSDSMPLFRIGREKKSAAMPPSADTLTIFSGIGRLRIPMVSNPAGTIIIAVSFPYPADDRPFAEELASRINDFRSIASQYFANLPAEQLHNLNEEAAKAEILRHYNALLRLGKIETLYFGDFMVIE